MSKPIPSGMSPSPFLEEAYKAAERATALARVNPFPSTANGHLLFVPRNTDAQTPFQMSDAELEDVCALMKQAPQVMQNSLDAAHRPEGYTVGWNVGLAGGQSIAHAHAHIIGRMVGDAPASRGGIARVLDSPDPFYSSTHAMDAASLQTTELEALDSSLPLMENAHAVVIASPHPVVAGHVLVLPKRGVANYHDLTAAEMVAMVRLAQQWLTERCGLDVDDPAGEKGANIGWNAGVAAGQTYHRSAAMEVVPRTRGDVAQARGGIAKILPPLAADYYRGATTGVQTDAAGNTVTAPDAQAQHFQRMASRMRHLWPQQKLTEEKAAMTVKKPTVLAVETAVTDAIYSGGNEALKGQFFSEMKSLLDAHPQFKDVLRESPRAGDNIMLPAEAWQEALLAFGEKHQLLSMPRAHIREEDEHACADVVSTLLFGTAKFQAGGSLANTFDAMVHSTLDGKSLVDGTFITAVGDDVEGRIFEKSLAGHIDASKGGRQFVAHIIPTGKDRIIVATSSRDNPCDAYLDATKLQDPAVLNADTDMVMLGGYLFYTPHFKAVFDTALKRIEALNQERAAAGKEPIRLVMTCASQEVSRNPEFRRMFERAIATTDVIVHANTGEFRRLLDDDTAWRAPHEHKWQGLAGHALEAAKKADADYQRDKAQANLNTMDNLAIPLARSCLPRTLQFVVTNGSKGSYVVDTAGRREHPTTGVNPKDIVNTVGAGDNFAAGYELGVLLERTEAQAMDLARAFASTVIQQDPPRIDAGRTRDYHTPQGIRTAGGALSCLPDNAAGKTLIARLASVQQGRSI